MSDDVIEGTVVTTVLEHDDKGRRNTYLMTDRELFLEIVTSLRSLDDFITDIARVAETNPMLKMFLPR